MGRHGLRRGTVAALLVGTLVVPLSGASGATTPAPAPPPLPALTAGTLDTRYAAARDAGLEAARAAGAHGDRERADALEELAGPGRHLLSLDGRGDGLAVEVLGDLATADRVAVLVPGSDTTLDTFDPPAGAGNPAGTLGGAARALYESLRRDGGPDTAVVAWLGYDTPATVGTDVLGTGRAERGADALRAFLGALHRARPGAGVALLCHSYGAVVCGRAAEGADRLGVSDIAFYGSPGTGADSAAGLRSGTRVWAGQGGGDWIAHVPHAGPGLLGTGLGLGPDPVDGDYGADRFAAGDAGHSDYLRPGTESLRNLTRIAAGQPAGVTRD
jgi:hypothetical protein